MTNLVKLEFVALDVSENNYLSWFLDMILHLSANSLKDTIDFENNPLTLWNNLKDIFDHQKPIHLPYACSDWLI